MNINMNKRLMLLLKRAIFLVITLFSVVIFTNEVKAASFQYSDFKWEEFLETHNNYWTIECSNSTDINGCKEKILNSHEKFYTKLYKLLAKYESSRNLHVSDSVIIATIFNNLSPEYYTDNGESYKDKYGTTNNYYQMEENEVDDAMVAASQENLEKYLKKETDTLNMLIKNAIGYQSTCYIVLGDAETVTSSDGSSRKECSNSLLEQYGLNMNNSILVLEQGNRSVCALKEKTYSLGEKKFLIGKYEKDKDEFNNECKKIASEKYNGEYIFDTTDKAVVDYNKYFDFLYEEDYLDGKAHLQNYYYESILKPAGVECMTKSLCGNNSLESKNLYSEYKEEIEDARLKIINEIIDSANRVGESIYYDKNYTDYTLYNQTTFNRNNFYWPIGNSFIETDNDIKMADGKPDSIKILSYFGTRNSIMGANEYHYGVDIEGTENTNVIAALAGEVVEIVSNCSIGEYSCNGGLGNSITISHSSGDYTIYAGLSSIDSNIKIGKAVKKGEYLGKVGKTGYKNTTSLHFELRLGGNDVTYSVDPLEYISANNPRPEGSSYDFSIHETALTKEEFVSKLNIYCTNNKCSDSMKNIFVANAASIYTESTQNNLNPEFVVVRAIAEGFSPGTIYYNYWGIGCTNGAPQSACSKYTSLENGIRGLAGLNIVKENETATGLMLRYSYIGTYWYNLPSGKVDWGLGGCPYYPYIKEYLSPERSMEVAEFCTKVCNQDGSGECAKTTDEDQLAYAIWQVEQKMGKDRYNIFGL